MRVALVLVLVPTSMLLGDTMPSREAGAATAYSPITPLPEAARSRLLRFVASEDTDAFLADSLVKPKLPPLLGEELPHLLQNVDVRGSVAFSSGMVYVVGNAPHRGLEEHGFIGVEVYSGRVCAAVFSKGRFDVYGAGTNRDGIPVALREWLLATWAYTSLEGSIPATARLVGETRKR